MPVVNKIRFVEGRHLGQFLEKQPESQLERLLPPEPRGANQAQLIVSIATPNDISSCDVPSPRRSRSVIFGSLIARFAEIAARYAGSVDPVDKGREPSRKLHRRVHLIIVPSIWKRLKFIEEVGQIRCALLQVDASGSKQGRHLRRAVHLWNRWRARSYTDSKHPPQMIVKR